MKKVSYMLSLLLKMKEKNKLDNIILIFLIIDNFWLYNYFVFFIYINY